MNDLTVKRSNNLIEARYNLSSGQNDIIDLVLSKIKDDNEVLYTIDVKDYADLFYNSNHIYRDLKKAADEFLKRNSGFKLYNYKGEEEQSFFWFVKIVYKNKEGKIIFKLDKEVKEIMLEIKNTTYYNIRYTLNMSSNYAKRMYMYLKRFEDTGYRIDKVIDLLNKLECPTSYYEKYNFFKQRVLQVSQKEINGHTDITFTFEEIKTGKKVTSLKFYINSIKKPIEIKKVKTKINNSLKDKGMDIDDLIDQLQVFISEPIKIKDLKAILKAADNDVKLIQAKYELAKQQSHIENLTAWLISAVKDDYTEPVSRTKKNRFVNYEQENYDFDKLEQLEQERIKKDLESSRVDNFDIQSILSELN